MIKILNKETYEVKTLNDTEATKLIFKGGYIVMEVGLQEKEEDYTLSEDEALELIKQSEQRIKEIEEEANNINQIEKPRGRFYWGLKPKEFIIKDDYSNLNKKELAAFCYRCGVPINHWRTKPETIRLIKEKLGKQ